MRMHSLLPQEQTSDSSKTSRGPYRSLRPTPRQTLYNRKRRRTTATTQDTVPQCSEDGKCLQENKSILCTAAHAWLLVLLVLLATWSLLFSPALLFVFASLSLSSVSLSSLLYTINSEFSSSSSMNYILQQFCFESLCFPTKGFLFFFAHRLPHLQFNVEIIFIS